MQIKHLKYIENRPDLPSNFAVVSGKTALAAITNVARAYQRPGVNAVLWEDAGDRVQPAHRAEIARIVAQDEPFFTRDAFSGSAQRTPAFGGWMNSTEEIWSALATVFGLSSRTRSDNRYGIERKYSSTTPAEKVGRDGRRLPKKYGLHVDNMLPNEGMLLRTVGGDGTVLAGKNDYYAVETPIEGSALRRSITVELKDEADTLWTVKPWQVLFTAGPSLREDAAHTWPALDIPACKDASRCLEKFYIKSSKPIASPGRWYPHT